MKTPDDVPVEAPALSHSSRRVSSVSFQSYYLGSEARNAFPWQETASLLINPTGALRRTNPGNLAAWDTDKQLRWVLPVSCLRLVLENNEPDSSSLQTDLWSQLVETAGGMTDPAPIWGTGAPVGTEGVELGATGSRPRGRRRPRRPRRPRGRPFGPRVYGSTCVRSQALVSAHGRSVHPPQPDGSGCRR